MTILDYYEGLAREKRQLAQTVAEPREPKTPNELRQKYYKTIETTHSVGANRVQRNYRRELRNGKTHGDFIRELKKRFPKEYALTVLLPSMQSDYPYCYESKKDYSKKISEVAKDYGLNHKEIQKYYVVK
jgi:hypothetical protein